MPDREKVIKAMEICVGNGHCSKCGYHLSDYYATAPICQNQMMADALALLKEQEAVEPEWKSGIPFCGNCGHRLQKKNRNAVGIKCSLCGRSVKWE